MFKITRGSGFSITFANGYTISVQFGPGNYCDNYDMCYQERVEAGKKGSMTAECAVFQPDGNFYNNPEWNDVVSPRNSPEEVLQLMNNVASL